MKTATKITDQFVEKLPENKSVITLMNLLAEWDILHLVNKQIQSDNKELIQSVGQFLISIKILISYWKGSPRK